MTAEAKLEPTPPPAPVSVIVEETGPGTKRVGEPSRIAFGSCHDTTHAPIWEPVLTASPDVWVWLGDTVYADTQDMGQKWRAYARVLAEPGYRALERSTRILGIWDDHDYGVNDAGKEYAKRAESQQLFLDFIGEPRGTPRRAQEGVYAAYTTGPPNRRIQFVLLDTRYHRDAPDTPDGDVLGIAQWKWLESELHEPAQLRIIASSIQVIAEEHRWEKWSNFPTARQRLFDVIARSGAQGVLFLSGDRHFAEISRFPETPAGYPLYDVTSSSMSRPWDEPPSEQNRYRIAGPYWQVNFGVLDVYWESDPQLVVLQILDAAGRVQLEHEIALSELRTEKAAKARSTEAP